MRQADSRDGVIQSEMSDLQLLKKMKMVDRRWRQNRRNECCLGPGLNRDKFIELRRFSSSEKLKKKTN